MGGSRFSASAFADYGTRNLLSATGDRLSLHDTFNYTAPTETWQPVNISVRESRDSEANPESRAIIFGIDFTASMGHIAHEMVNEYVPKIMTTIIDGAVKDPHLMAMAIRDYKASRDTPLQVSQFEGDHKVVEQMQDFYGCSQGGGGNLEESYALAWAFAAYKTSIDCYEKRGVKGYLFTIGDDGPQEGSMSDSELQALVGGGEAGTVEKIQADAAEKYELFHIHIARGRSGGWNDGEIMERWKGKLGNRAMRLTDYTKVPELVNAVIAINEGTDPYSLELIPEVSEALGLTEA